MGGLKYFRLGLRKVISQIGLSLIYFLLILVASPIYADAIDNGVFVSGHSGQVDHPSSLVFIDAGVRDKQLLLSGMAKNAKAIILRSDSDGIQQISDALKNYRQLDSIQIISHGAPAKLILGSISLTDSNLSHYKSYLQTWGNSLRPHGGILLYGCNAAQGVVGDRFVDRVSNFTGAPIAASTDVTGSPSLSGNWVLEKRTGSIAVINAIGEPALSLYNHLLAPPSDGSYDVSDTFSTPAGTTRTGVGGYPTNTQWDSTWSSLTYDGGPIDTWITGIARIGSGFGDYIDIADAGYTSNTDANTHWFRVTVDDVNAASFELTDIILQNYLGSDNFDVTVTGYRVGGGTVVANTTYASASAGSISSVLGSFSGVQITSFDLAFSTSNSSPIGDFTFVSFGIANAAAPSTTPTVTGISPSSGPTAGGTGVTITGSNFTGTTGVTIGGGAATGVTVVNDTTITATTPSGTVGAKDVVVTNASGSGTGTGLFTYVAAPTVTGISPSSGPTAGGTSVTITGTNLTDATSVTIGGASATGVSVVNSTTITATTPAGTAGARNVAVTTPGGTGTGTGLFTYVAAPTVTGISPSGGPIAGGTSVTITGTNLTDATSVTIGGASATGVTVVNSTTITATTPAGTAGARDVAVTTVGGTGTGTGLYTYYAVPTVTGISPSSGPVSGGTSVTITGTNLTDATSVTIGGASATGVTVINSTTITATTPAGTAGARDVAVTTPGGTGTGTGLFTYAAAPTVTGISPSSGPSSGGTSVTITGTNLTDASSVTIGGAPATGVTVVNSTTITATTPAGTAGARDVAVTTVGGTGTGTGLFTYIAAPTVTAISPTGGPTAGGTSVTITGTNLTGASSVTIGGAPATGVSVVNSTTITATTPSGTAGSRDVAVTTVGGTGTGTGLFTYYAVPTVTGISPSSGPTAGGTSVTITGTNLTGATAVTIGGAPATGVSVVNSTTITATTPSGTVGARDVAVTTPGGTGTGTGLFTYVAAPTVTGISPSSGSVSGGTSVTITGTNLTGATGVTIGGSSATGVTVVNSTTITATTPSGTAGARDVAVTTVGGTGTGTGLFTYIAAPTVTAISPTGGPTAGGTSVTITGTNFTGATSVTIGGSSATGVTVVNSTTITATTPSGTAGARDVAVTTVGGTGTGTGLFTYYAVPTVTGISPSSGPAAGGTSVTITGTNLTGATSVTIGGAPATGVTVVNSTTITATTPAGAAGARDVAVTTPGGTGTGTGLFTYIAAPTVTGISPNSGSIAGGTSVTITGTDFTGATSVTIGGAPATGVSVVNSTTITATTPSGTAGARDVAVTTVGGTGTGTGMFTYYAAPTVIGISPSSGPTAGGTSVTITGTNFTGATAVTIGGAPATGVSVVNSTTITATTPSGTAGARDVAVTTPGGTGTGTGLFTYVAAPTVTGISPSSGPAAGGTSVTITGTNLTGATAVTIGGASATGVSVVNSTTITATTPSGTAGVSDVAVTTVGGTGTGTGLFTYIAAPTVTGISPSSGSTAGGTSVTITGTNLTGATSVTIGGASATGVTVVNSTTITATTPSGTAGARDVAVTTVGGTGTGTGLFTYIVAPTVTGISPSSGPTAGGTSVTITGTSFTGATSVTIGGSAATGVTVVNDTTITATTPAGTAGARDVIVTNSVGSGTGTGLYTYVAAPTVTGISPASGPDAGGTSVTITGTNLTGATGVTIGGSAATGITVVNSTTITATTPAGTAGARDVVVTTIGGTGTGTGLFTYLSAPGAPTGATASGGDTQATVNFTAPASDGGSAITTYTATSSPGGLTGTCAGPAACAITVTGLTNGTAYTFTVTATNAIGTGAPSAASNSITPAAGPTVPDAPTSVTATAGYGQATINFSAPASDGGSAIITYTATSSPSGLTGTCSGPTACAITVTGLAGGTAYTFTVTATNVVGTGAASAVSNSVTVIVRPDPTQDADVVGLVEAQAKTANRFWRTQTSNYHQRLESMHHAARKHSATADSLLMNGDSLSLSPDSESFAGAGRASLQGMVRQDRMASMGDDVQVENDAGSELLMSGFDLANEIANVLNTSSLNINLAAFDYDLGSSAGDTAGVEIWGAGNVRIGKRESHDGSSEIDYSTDGVTFGIDHWFSDNLLLGMGIGYAHDESEIGSNGTENSSDGKSIAVYASYQPGDAVFIDGVLGYGTLDLDSSRYDTLTDSTAKASRDGEQLFGSIAVGYEYLNETTLISPYARYDMAVSRLDSATETGAGIGSLDYGSQTYTSKQLSFGLRAGFQHKTDSYMFQPRARIEFQHRIDGGDDASIAYADTLSTRYNMATPTNSDNSLLLGLGSSFVLRNGLNLDIDYQWVRSNDNDDSQAIFLRISKPLGGD